MLFNCRRCSVGGIYIGNGSNISVSSHKSEFTVGSSISVVFPYGKHPSYTSMKQNCQVSKKKELSDRKLKKNVR